MPNAPYWIEKLGLTRHPEGGWFRETYRAPVTVDQSALPEAFKGHRSTCTAIYFLLEGDDFSAFHKLAADELWHFYAGDAVAVHCIDKDRQHVELRLGSNIENGETLQAVVPADLWFGSRLMKPGTFALVGCTVSPGFDFEDFEMADRSALTALYPEHGHLIASLTRESVSGGA